MVNEKFRKITGATLLFGMCLQGCNTNLKSLNAGPVSLQTNTNTAVANNPIPNYTPYSPNTISQLSSQNKFPLAKPTPEMILDKMGFSANEYPSVYEVFQKNIEDKNISKSIKKDSPLGRIIREYDVRKEALSKIALHKDQAAEHWFRDVSGKVSMDLRSRAEWQANALKAKTLNSRLLTGTTSTSVSYTKGSGVVSIPNTSGATEIIMKSGIALSDVYLNRRNGYYPLYIDFYSSSYDEVQTSYFFTSGGAIVTPQTITTINFEDGGFIDLTQPLKLFSKSGTVYGTTGSDIYLYYKGDNVYSIYKPVNTSPGSILMKSGIALTDVYLNRRNGYYPLYIDFYSNSYDEVQINNFFTPGGAIVTPQPITTINFEDGGSIDLTQPLKLFSKSGTVYGTTGNDTYLYNKGYGVYSIYKPGNTSPGSILMKSGIALTDVYLYRGNGYYPLYIDFYSNSYDEVQINNFFTSGGAIVIPQPITTINFEDGGL